MANPHLTAPRLVTGMRMSREEFLRVWEELPELKCAELIDGVVYVASPVGPTHGTTDSMFQFWLTYYAVHTPGCESGSNTTWHMIEDAPQPDSHLRILQQFGGMSRVEGNRLVGVPELAIEVSQTAAASNLRAKLALYRKAGVREQIVADVPRQRIEWLSLSAAGDTAIEPSADGTMRSKVFPGLWLDPEAFWARDGLRILRVLDQGLAATEHRVFVESLQPH